MNLNEIKKIGVKNLVLLLIAGILLLICTIPGMKGDKEENVTGNDAEYSQEASLVVTDTPIPSEEERLKTILSTIDGVGKTEVMIFYSCSEEQVPLLDEKGNPIRSVKTESEAYIMKTKAPEMEGILIVAEGAKKAEIIQWISDAAEALFGLPKHKIIVLPMR